jgi:hypothetical protein
MPTFTVPKGAIAKGPGTLFYANPGTSLPDYTVASSVFSVNTWTGWTQWGITKNGSVWKVDLDTVPIKAEEYVDDIDQVIKGRAVTVDFELMNVTAALAVRATNRPHAVHDRLGDDAADHAEAAAAGRRAVPDDRLAVDRRHRTDRRRERVPDRDPGGWAAQGRRRGDAESPVQAVPGLEW